MLAVGAFPQGDQLGADAAERRLGRRRRGVGEPEASATGDQHRSLIRPHLARRARLRLHGSSGPRANSSSQRATPGRSTGTGRGRHGRPQSSRVRHVRFRARRVGVERLPSRAGRRGARACVSRRNSSRGDVRVEAGGVGSQPLFRIAEDRPRPVNVFERYSGLPLPRPEDALGPGGLDRLVVGVLGNAEDEERPDLLARQRRRWRSGHRASGVSLICHRSRRRGVTNSSIALASSGPARRPRSAGDNRRIPGGFGIWTACSSRNRCQWASERSASPGPTADQGQVLLHPGVVADGRQRGLETAHGPCEVLRRAAHNAEQVADQRGAVRVRLAVPASSGRRPGRRGRSGPWPAAASVPLPPAGRPGFGRGSSQARRTGPPPIPAGRSSAAPARPTRSSSTSSRPARLGWSDSASRRRLSSNRFSSGVGASRRPAASSATASSSRPSDSRVKTRLIRGGRRTGDQRPERRRRPSRPATSCPWRGQQTALD